MSESGAPIARSRIAAAAPGALPGLAPSVRIAAPGGAAPATGGVVFRRPGHRSRQRSEPATHATPPAQSPLEAPPDDLVFLRVKRRRNDEPLDTFVVPDSATPSDAAGAKRMRLFRRAVTTQSSSSLPTLLLDPKRRHDAMQNLTAGQPSTGGAVSTAEAPAQGTRMAGPAAGDAGGAVPAASSAATRRPEEAEGVDLAMLVPPGPGPAKRPTVGLFKPTIPKSGPRAPGPFTAAAAAATAAAAAPPTGPSTSGDRPLSPPLSPAFPPHPLWGGPAPPTSGSPRRAAGPGVGAQALPSGEMLLEARTDRMREDRASSRQQTFRIARLRRAAPTALDASRLTAAERASAAPLAAGARLIDLEALAEGHADRAAGLPADPSILGPTGDRHSEYVYDVYCEADAGAAGGPGGHAGRAGIDADDAGTIESFDESLLRYANAPEPSGPGAVDVENYFWFDDYDDMLANEYDQDAMDDDEDSNAEDFWANDYPDEEEDFEDYTIGGYSDEEENYGAASFSTYRQPRRQYGDDSSDSDGSWSGSSSDGEGTPYGGMAMDMEANEFASRPGRRGGHRHRHHPGAAMSEDGDSDVDGGACSDAPPAYWSASASWLCRRQEAGDDCRTHGPSGFRYAAGDEDYSDFSDDGEREVARRHRDQRLARRRADEAEATRRAEDLAQLMDRLGLGSRPASATASPASRALSSDRDVSILWAEGAAGAGAGAGAGGPGMQPGQQLVAPVDPAVWRAVDAGSAGLASGPDFSQLAGMAAGGRVSLRVGYSLSSEDDDGELSDSDRRLFSRVSAARRQEELYSDDFISDEEDADEEEDGEYYGPTSARGGGGLAGSSAHGAWRGIRPQQPF
ncbi:hypothetical protein H696_05833 [Fonticula alba]|uniref:Probable RNA polymerase II nuclear localization protein SLC7A6OS n=1 Tax=Fonticula alba TaxID=691883 RepID=A0A058Z0D8_FONAL|nr:hypothetical protein H696_05833 [Fonticula alba]KCV67725.1 hypothetical protein H696_05833 [Fonticula alba]|eukprot:XP_009497909.1 hypothetical protein H696_05833 [Fonticula alba]